MKIQELNASNTRYVAERHACGSALYFIRTRDGWLIDSAMSLKAALAWMTAHREG